MDSIEALQIVFGVDGFLRLNEQFAEGETEVGSAHPTSLSKGAYIPLDSAGSRISGGQKANRIQSFWVDITSAELVVNQNVPFSEGRIEETRPSEGPIERLDSDNPEKVW